MSPFEIILLIFCIGLAGALYVIFQQLKQSTATQTPVVEWLKSMSVNMQQSDKNVTDTLQRSYQALNERLEYTSRIMAELKEETGKFSEIGRSMQSLQDFLNSPKMRGNIGEQVLTELLNQVLPKSTYHVQYRFHTGDIVDAVIETKAGLIAIDSKFPLENYMKFIKTTEGKEKEDYKRLFVADVKKHIKTISQKYINTSEKTVDFALMYIPAEAVYYELTANQPEIGQYAQDLRVLLVSPSTFYAFLRTILVSFEGQRIAKEAQLILQELRSIQKDASGFAAKLDTLSRHITNAYNNMNVINNEFNQLNLRIRQTNSLGNGLDQQLPTSLE